MPFRYKTYRISFLMHNYNLIMYILVKVLMHLCLAAYQAATLCVRYEINLGLSTVSISSQGHSGFAVPLASLTCYAASATKQSRRCLAPPVNHNCQSNHCSILQSIFALLPTGSSALCSVWKRANRRRPPVAEISSAVRSTEKE